MTAGHLLAAFGGCVMFICALANVDAALMRRFYGKPYAGGIALAIATALMSVGLIVWAVLT